MNKFPVPIRSIGLAMFLDIRSYLGQRPFVFGCVQKVMPSRRSLGLVVRDTQLCIEAPPGSGNSYFVNGFQMANRGGVRLAHHQHVAAQVKRSVHFRTPILVILRNPVDCVVSRTWHSPLLAGAVFRQWIRFFRAVDEVRNSILIASFESVISNPGKVVEGINERFDTSFDVRFPEEKLVFERMDAAYSVNKGAPGRRNPNRLIRDKQLLKEQVRPGIEAHELAKTARGLYEKLLAQAV
jgi:hypothetical protein